MLTVRTRLAEGGWIVIPAEYCQALGLHTGDEVILLLEDGAICLLTRSQAVRRAQELVSPLPPTGTLFSRRIDR